MRFPTLFSRCVVRCSFVPALPVPLPGTFAVALFAFVVCALTLLVPLRSVPFWCRSLVVPLFVVPWFTDVPRWLCSITRCVRYRLCSLRCPDLFALLMRTVLRLPVRLLRGPLPLVRVCVMRCLLFVIVALPDPFVAFMICYIACVVVRFVLLTRIYIAVHAFGVRC